MNRIASIFLALFALCAVSLGQTYTVVVNPAQPGVVPIEGIDIALPLASPGTTHATLSFHAFSRIDYGLESTAPFDRVATFYYAWFPHWQHVNGSGFNGASEENGCGGQEPLTAWDHQTDYGGSSGFTALAITDSTQVVTVDGTPFQVQNTQAAGAHVMHLTAEYVAGVHDQNYSRRMFALWYRGLLTLPEHTLTVTYSQD